MDNDRKDLNKLYDEYIAEGIDHIRKFINSYNYEDEGNNEKRMYAIEKLTTLVEVFAEVKTLIADYIMDDELSKDSYPDEHNLNGFTELEVFKLIGIMLCGMDILKGDTAVVERASEESLKRAAYTSVGDLGETVKSILGTDIDDDDDDDDDKDEDGTGIAILGVDYGKADASVLKFISKSIYPFLTTGEHDPDFMNFMMKMMPYQKMMLNLFDENGNETSPYVHLFTGRVEKTKIQRKLTDEEMKELCEEERSSEEQSLIDEVNEEATDDFLKDLFKKKGSGK